MSAILPLSAVALVSWMLRITFITLVPPARVPAGFRQALTHVGPAVLGALIAVHLGADVAGPTTPWPRLLALLAAAVVAWRHRNLAATVATALGGYWALTTLWP